MFDEIYETDNHSMHAGSGAGEIGGLVDRWILGGLLVRSCMGDGSNRARLRLLQNGSNPSLRLPVVAGRGAGLLLESC